MDTLRTSPVSPAPAARLAHTGASGYRREIDGLRALAVLPVMLFHAGFSTFKGGFVGVDVFFVISGYLITGIIIADLDRGRFTLANFYERRARRILPALFVVIAATLPWAYRLLPPKDLQEFSSSVLAVLGFVSNIFFWRKSDYFDTAAELKPLLHTWSLAVEEQFYVLFPLFLAAAYRLGKRRLLALMASLAVLSLAAAQFGAIRWQAFTFFLLPTRGWELLIGALLAVACGSGRQAPGGRAAAEVGSLAGMALLLYSVFAFDENTPFPSLYALTPTLGTALLILFAVPQTWVGKVLGARALVGIGLVSYSAYLWHQPLLAFARYSSSDPPTAGVMAGLLVAALLLAVASWRWVEVPVRNKSVIDRRSLVLMALGGAALLGAAGAAGIATQGFSKVRLPPEVRAVLSSAESSPKRNECHAHGPNYRQPAEACVYHVATARWAVLGDSHAVELAYGMAEELRPLNIGVRHLSFSACRPRDATREAPNDCSRWTDEAVASILSDPTVTDVAVSYRLNAALFGVHEGVYPALPDAVPEDVRQGRWEAYRAMLQKLVDAGKHVTVVLQAPELPKSIDRLAMHGAPGGQVAGVPARWWRARSTWVMSRLAELPPQVGIVDPAALFCDADRCYAARDGIAFYFDDHHMSVAGTRRVAQKILQDMNARQ